MRLLLRLLTLSLLLLAVIAQPANTTTAQETEDLEKAMGSMFNTLALRTFAPERQDHQELYYKTRFFTAHLQARMRYIVATYDEQASEAAAAEEQSSESDGSSAIANDVEHASVQRRADSPKETPKESTKDPLYLTKSEAEQLNEIKKEMWLVSRKMYQQAGCMTYDLSLCNSMESKGLKLSKTEKQALMEWEQRLSEPAVADKVLTRDEAEGIRAMMKAIQSVLLNAVRRDYPDAN
ncbi:hypothetical protein FBU59_005386 [Linderina macrospora]|uniref:Uncharacterized protein n=1 Tax=Linderina macrospora TaxID=4868 RepID=A0ACC1J350_9FUNG|nr:hypothetical protein FBU59_005386 [Linderina macrospora]